MCLSIPAKIVELLPEHFAKVDIGGVQKKIHTALLEDLHVGDYVLVHVGLALNKIDPDEAQKTLELISELFQYVDDKSVQYD